MENQEIQEALRPIRAAYYTRVREIAEEVFSMDSEARHDE